MQTTENAISLNDLLTVEELAAKYPKILSIHTLRWQLRYRGTNGLAMACVRGLGRKLLISESRFENWLATQTDARRAAA